jgi:hypothetical protein
MIRHLIKHAGHVSNALDKSGVKPDVLIVIKEYLALQQSKEHHITERLQIVAHRDTAVMEIEAQRDAMLEYFRLRFADREKTLSQFFDVLRTAVVQKDHAALDAALAGILAVSSESPLRDFQAFKRFRETDDILEV